LKVKWPSLTGKIGKQIKKFFWGLATDVLFSYELLIHKSNRNLCFHRWKHQRITYIILSTVLSRVWNLSEFLGLKIEMDFSPSLIFGTQKLINFNKIAAGVLCNTYCFYFNIWAKLYLIEGILSTEMVSNRISSLATFVASGMPK